MNEKVSGRFFLNTVYTYISSNFLGISRDFVDLMEIVLLLVPGSLRVRAAPYINTFRRHLKTCLFSFTMPLTVTNKPYHPHLRFKSCLTYTIGLRYDTIAVE